METLEGVTYGGSEKKFTVLNIHAPTQTKMIRFNKNRFMTKLRKEIMKRSKLRNKFNRNRNHQNWYNFKIQRNYCRKRFRKTKKQHYKNLSVQDVTENQTSRKLVILIFKEFLRRMLKKK